jgi:hypothetical protein
MLVTGGPPMTIPTAPRDPSPAVLDAALKRRAELRTTIRELTRALEAPAVGRESAWMERVVPRLEALQSDIDEHIERTEAEDGLYDEIRTAQPRLSNQVRRLIADHEVLRDRIAACHALATHATGAPDPVIVKTVRNDASHIVSLLQRHRQRGSDLIFEAYETDIGGDE